MSKNTIQDFLNPKSSLTIASMTAIVVTVATIISQDFHLNVAYVALGLSLFLSALQTFNSTNVEGIVQKLAYTLLTGLIIFAGARGGNITLSNIEAPKQEITLVSPPMQPINTDIKIMTKDIQPPEELVEMNVQQTQLFKKW